MPSNQREELVRDGGSAGSVPICSSRMRLLPRSDNMSLLSPGIWAKKSLRFPIDRIYQPGYACKVLFTHIFGKGNTHMAHTTEEKKRLLNRVRRIMGQVAAIEKTLDQEGECSEVLHNISACRGAMDALIDRKS